MLKLASSFSYFSIFYLFFEMHLWCNMYLDCGFFVNKYSVEKVNYFLFGDFFEYFLPHLFLKIKLKVMHLDMLPHWIWYITLLYRFLFKLGHNSVNMLLELFICPFINFLLFSQKPFINSITKIMWRFTIRFNNELMTKHSEGISSPWPNCITQLLFCS